MGATTTLPPLEALSHDLPIVLDSTLITSFRSCPQKFFLAHMQHLRGGEESLPLLAGGTFAAGLEAYRWKAYTTHFTPSVALEFALEAMTIRWGDYEVTDPRETRTFDKVVGALYEYFKRWPVHEDPIRPMLQGEREDPTFEFSFAVELDPARGFPLHPSGSPFLYSGRFDLMGSLSGLPVIEDDKTTKALGPTWADQWNMRHQFMGYIWALKQLGYPARHVVVRGIGLKTKIEIVETPPIHIPDHMLDKFEEALKSTVRDMISASVCVEMGDTHFPRNFGDACMSYFRPCTYTSLCSATPQNELGFMKTMNREKWDPLGTERIVDLVRTFRKAEAAAPPPASLEDL